MKDRIKEHDRDIRPASTETSAVSEHAHNTRHKPQVTINYLLLLSLLLLLLLLLLPSSLLLLLLLK